MFGYGGGGWVGGDLHERIVLPPHHHHAPIRRPAQRPPLPPQLHSRRAALAPYVPELARPIAGDGGEFGFFGWVPADGQDPARVAPEFGAVAYAGLLGVPDAEGAVGGTGRD